MSKTAFERGTRPHYVIEHMEEDDPDAPSKFPRWALLEYRNMLKFAGRGTQVHFTNLSKNSIADLEQALQLPEPGFGRVEDSATPCLHPEPFDALLSVWGVAKSDVCLLDPRAPLPLDVSDAAVWPGPAPASAPASAVGEQRDGPFHVFLFGGILGDDPPRDRTAALRQHGYGGRHLGTVQMTTDTALGVTKKVVEDGMHLGVDGAPTAPPDSRGNGQMVWVNHPELKFTGGAAVSMPFRYMIDPRPAAVISKEENVRVQTSRGEKPPLMPPGMRALILSDLDRSFEF